jgi:hypothetical protein
VTAATLRLSTGDALVYRCDVKTHRVIVSDGTGRLRFAFGGHGSRTGQLDTPLDVAFVAPEFHGEHLPARVEHQLWIAVADYGNRRVQVFELDGCFVGTVGDETDGSALGGPCRLVWRSPVLDVEHADGRRSRMHLAAALLYGSARGLPSRRPAVALDRARACEVWH